jgi:hypothetical protein
MFEELLPGLRLEYEQSHVLLTFNRRYPDYKPIASCPAHSAS